MFLGRQDTSTSHTVLLSVAEAKFWVRARESWGLPWSFSGKESACNAENAGHMGSIPGWEDPLEEEMATCSSILG